MSFIVTREKRSHKADSIRSAAADLRAAGYSLCRINPNEKRPTYEEWPTRSLEPKEFGPDDLLGIICGPLSDAGRPGHALVVVDLDQPDAMNLATEFLPPTERIVGRRSKPRAHWYYLVPLTSIPEWAKSPAEQGATAAKDRTGHPGPFKKQFRHRETNVGVIDFVDTGGQVVAPHSLHPSGEIREWSDEPPGEPAVVEFPALWAVVCKLAAACGCEIPKIAHASVLPPTPRPESVEQAIAYLGNMSPAVSGSGGHGQLFAAARAVVWGFELGPEVGFDVLRTHYNPRCSPPWSDSELRHKCEEANRISFDRPRGDLNDSGEPSASNSDAGAPEVCLAIKPDGKRMHKVTVTANGVPVTVDTVNLGTATGRKRVLDAVVEKIPGANRKDLEAELVRVATGTDSGGTAAPVEHPEVDVSRVVRPELFHTPGVSALTVAVLSAPGGKPIPRWRTYLRWSDGSREHRNALECVTLPDGATLYVSPDPGEPTGSDPPAWSTRSRTAWFTGAPAPEPGAVFERVRDQFDRYLDFPPSVAEGARATVALWTLFTYAYPAWDALPYLFIGGPMASGKSRVLDVLQRLVFRPLSSANMTAPALFRTLHASGGTLLYDEAERLRQSTPDQQELQSMLLAGYRRGACATRLETVGEGFRPVRFNVYGPKALACIAGLPPPLASRCIPITMFRSAPGSEKPKRRLDENPEAWQAIRDDLHVLALEHGSRWTSLAGCSTVVPTGIAGRNHELWQPLLALAGWLEECGSPGLLGLLREYAVLSVEGTRDDAIPEADEVLLEVLAETVRTDEAPTSADLLREARDRDEGAFRLWAPRTVTARLKSYGIPAPTKAGGRRAYRDVSLETLYRIGERYGIDLGLTEPERGECGT